VKQQFTGNEKSVMVKFGSIMNENET